MNPINRYLEPTLVEHLNHLALSAASVVEGTTSGQHRSPVKGASVEFRQHRFYVPGDEPRRLDWRVLGRTDRPYVKEYDEETNLRCVLLLDASGSMAYAGAGGDAKGGKRGDGAPDVHPGLEQRVSKFEFAARLTAALAYLMLAQTESAGLAVTSGRANTRFAPTWLAPHAGPSQLSRLLDLLERSEAEGPSTIAAAMHAVAERLERRALVIVLSDLFSAADSLRAGLAHLRHGRHEVRVVQTIDPDEQDFPFRHWMRFRGLEGEAAKVCEPALIRKRYQENFNRHRRALMQACQGLRCDFKTLTTDRPTLDAVRMLVGRPAVLSA